MENIIFDVLLFFLFYGFLVWITDGGDISFSDPENEAKEASDPIGEELVTPPSPEPEVIPTPQMPIEQQVKEMLWDDEGVSTPDGSKFDESLIDSLSKLKLRKVAKELHVTQTRTLTIDGKKQKKDKDKAWLIRDIKQKIRKGHISNQEIKKILIAAA